MTGWEVKVGVTFDPDNIVVHFFSTERAADAYILGIREGRGERPIHSITWNDTIIYGEGSKLY